MGHKSKAKRAFRKIAVVLFWLTVWQIVAVIVDKEILLVSPIVTAKRLFELAQEFVFWKASFVSLLRIMEGYLIGVFCATVTAIITTRFKFFYDLLKPILNVIKATPVASFIILALVWIRRDNVPAFAASLMVIPIVWGNVSEGILATDKDVLEMAKIFRLSGGKKFSKIYLPSVMPFFFAGCSTSLGMAWKAGIAAEVLSLPQLSIGKELYYSKIYIETADLFAWTAVVVTFSIVLESLLKRLLEKIGGET